MLPMSRPKCYPSLPQRLMKKARMKNQKKTGENKRVETPEEKQELILKEKSKERDTLIKPMPIPKCHSPFLKKIKEEQR